MQNDDVPSTSSLHAGTAPTVVSSSAAQSPQEQCLLAKLAAANPSAFTCAAGANLQSRFALYHGKHLMLLCRDRQPFVLHMSCRSHRQIPLLSNHFMDIRAQRADKRKLTSIRRSVAISEFNNTDCSTLSTAVAPSVAASAGPAVDNTQVGPLGLAEQGAGASTGTCTCIPWTANAAA